MSNQLNFNEIISDYFKNYNGLQQEMDGVKNSLIDAANGLGSQTGDEVWKKIVRGGHQRRMTKEVEKKMITILKGQFLLSFQYQDFEDIYANVERLIGNVKGVGRLTLYDVSRRIGHVLVPSIYPKKYVYLSQGAKVGADKLLGRPVQYREPTTVFAKFFGTLDSIYIEDILCIYKDYFVKGGIKKSLASGSKTCGVQSPVRPQKGTC